MWDMTHLLAWCVWHDSSICGTWLMQMWDMTHLLAWYNLFMCVTRLIDICDMTHSYVWHDSFMCVTWLIHMWDMTHLLTWYNLFMCDATHSYVWHDLFMCVTWLIHMWDMTPSYRRQRWGWGPLCVFMFMSLLNEYLGLFWTSIQVSFESVFRPLLHEYHDSILYVGHDSILYVGHDSILPAATLGMRSFVRIYVEVSFECVSRSLLNEHSGLFWMSI